MLNRTEGVMFNCTSKKNDNCQLFLLMKGNVIDLGILLTHQCKPEENKKIRP